MLVDRKKQLKHFLCFAAVLSSMSLASAEALVEAWFISGGLQNYQEPNMDLRGPELGIHMYRLITHDYAIEAEGFLGLQNYSSHQSGEMNNIPNIDTHWLLLRSSPKLRSWQYGVALHTHHNFFNGTTSLGFGGYNRHSTQIWLPIRWQSDSQNPWVVDTGWLLLGRHFSKLSQANSQLHDVENVQKRGAYLQALTTVTANQSRLHPYLRLTWVDKSDKHRLNFDGRVIEVYEPGNTRLQFGLKLRFR
jgi:hypothetical protein